MNKIDAIKNKISKVNSELDALRLDYWSTLTDRSIPLEERWTLYCNTPEMLKSTECDIINLESWPADFGRYITSTNERFRIVNMSQLYDSFLYKFPSGDVTALQEEILSSLSTHFVVDW